MTLNVLARTKKKLADVGKSGVCFHLALDILLTISFVNCCFGSYIITVVLIAVVTVVFENSFTLHFLKFTYEPLTQHTPI